MTKQKTPSELSERRQRIVDNMDAILNTLVKGEVGADFRPAIIESVQKIADLKTVPPSQARRALEVVEHRVDRLKQSIAKLPETMRDLVRVPSLDAARRQLERETGRTTVSRKMLAARVALDLMLEYGDKAPSLTKDGPYETLANLLYLTATGKEAALSRNCKQRFEDFNAAGFDFYSSKPGRRGSRPSAWLFEFMRSATPDYMKPSRSAGAWPPLERVVDEVLGRSN